jgi:hypothetical protein
MARPRGGTPDSKQSEGTWVCKCPREIPKRIAFCKRCGTSQG